MNQKKQGGEKIARIIPSPHSYGPPGTPTRCETSPWSYSTPLHPLYQRLILYTLHSSRRWSLRGVLPRDARASVGEYVQGLQPYVMQAW